jgi:hypothetical protein
MTSASIDAGPWRGFAPPGPRHLLLARELAMNADTEYSIVCRNESGQPHSVSVWPSFAPAPYVAWLAAHLAPNATIRFRWTLAYAVFRADTGPLQNGDTIVAAEIQPVGSTSKNRVRLEFDRGRLRFSEPTNGRAGFITIEQDRAVPPLRASIGIAINGMPAAVVQAQPAIIASFALHPTYKLAIGNGFNAGALVGEKTIERLQNVVFRDDETSVIVTL